MITFRCNGTLPFVVHFFNRDEPNDQTQMTWHTWTDVDKIRHIVPHKLSTTDLLIGPGAPHHQAVLHSPQPAALRPRMVLDSPHPFRVVLHSLLLLQMVLRSLHPLQHLRCTAPHRP